MKSESRFEPRHRGCYQMEGQKKLRRRYGEVNLSTAQHRRREIFVACKAHFPKAPLRSGIFPDDVALTELLIFADGFYKYAAPLALETAGGCAGLACRGKPTNLAPSEEIAAAKTTFV